MGIYSWIASAVLFRKIVSGLFVVLIAFVVSACSNKAHQRYIKKDIEPSTIAEHVRPGDRVQIKAEGWDVTMEVTKYESDKYLIGRDLFTKKEFKLPIETIEEIRTESSFASFDGPTAEEAGEYAIYSIMAVPLLPLAAVTYPAWHSDKEPPAKADSSENEFWISVSMDEVRGRLGEPLERYLCEGGYSMDGDEVWEYQKGVISDWLGGSKDVKFLSFDFPFETPHQAHDEESLKYFQPCRPLPDKYR